MTDTPMLDAYLRGQALREAFHDLTPQQINNMSLTEFAARTGRPTAAQAALQALGNQEPRTASLSTSEATQAPEDQPPGIDFSQLTVEQYAQLRGQLGIGQTSKEGVGLLNQSGQSWAQAARVRAGQAAVSTSNVVEPPKLTGRHLAPAQLDHRPAAERFSTPGNTFNL